MNKGPLALSYWMKVLHSINEGNDHICAVYKKDDITCAYATIIFQKLKVWNFIEEKENNAGRRIRRWRVTKKGKEVLKESVDYLINLNRELK